MVPVPPPDGGGGGYMGAHTLPQALSSTNIIQYNQTNAKKYIWK